MLDILFVNQCVCYTRLLAASDWACREVIGSATWLSAAPEQDAVCLLAVHSNWFIVIWMNAAENILIGSGIGGIVEWTWNA